MTCTQDGNANATCIFSPDFISNFKTSLGSGISFKKPSGAKVAALTAQLDGKVGSTSVPVCEDMSYLIPSECTCTDTSLGGTAMCSVDCNGLDTIEMEVDMNVCANPLEVRFVLVVVHLSDHNRVMVAQVDYHIRAEQSINGKETTEYIHKVSMI